MPSSDFVNLVRNEHLILNHLLLIFKMHIYTVRIGYLNISDLLTFIKSTKDTEKKLCENDAKRSKKINKKCFNKPTEVN